MRPRLPTSPAPNQTGTRTLRSGRQMEPPTRTPEENPLPASLALQSWICHTCPLYDRERRGPRVRGAAQGLRASQVRGAGSRETSLESGNTRMALRDLLAQHSATVPGRTTTPGSLCGKALPLGMWYFWPWDTGCGWVALCGGPVQREATPAVAPVDPRAVGDLALFHVAAGSHCAIGSRLPQPRLSVRDLAVAASLSTSTRSLLSKGV